MQTIWKRIEAWLESNAPELLPLLQPGANEEDIQRTEALLHITFPEDIKESYRLHNGSGFFLTKGHALLSLDQMVETWEFTVPPCEEEQDLGKPADDDSEFWQENEDEDWRIAIPLGTFLPERGYDRQLIPLLRWHDEGILCFDADPHDTYGVMFEYFAQSGLTFYAWSWRELLFQYADDLEAGKYDIKRENGYCALVFNDPTQRPI